jgi:two-component system, chemotaxis family, response regulator Rcp1
MTDKQFTILSIEDNQADFDLLEKALKNANASLQVINIQNGQEALDFVYKQSKHAKAPTPDIIILDINLPGINGEKLLEIFKKDEKCRVIPIIIFSTQNQEKEIKRMYELYANSYLTKTSDIKELFAKIASLEHYWFSTNELPSENNFYFVEEEK